MIVIRRILTNLISSRLRRSLAKFGSDIGIARKKRQLTVAMMAERLGVYAMALFALGFGDLFGEIIDPSGMRRVSFSKRSGFRNAFG